MPHPEPAQNGLRQFELHPLRSAVLGEVHARPFDLVEGPRIFLHYAFLTSGEGMQEERAWLNDLCASRGAPAVSESARFHRVPFGNGILRWEGHSEFSTYTWHGPPPAGAEPFHSEPADHPFGDAFRAPGPLLSAVRLELRPDPPDLAAACAIFDPVSLCVSQAEAGAARIATDLKQDRDGRTRILVMDARMSPQSAGALALRLLEIETYRTLALLGLPRAQEVSPDIRAVEETLRMISAQLPETQGMSANRDLLQTLSELAASVEALAGASAFRFGATRAYYEIVTRRLNAIMETPEEGYSTLATFLGRRLEPAMQTCLATERRLETLSMRLSRAAELLRTRVDVELEEQNRDLLDSMNRRARLQLRLQQTVEGLSVAAVSYYIVGLIGYAAKGAAGFGLTIDVPVTVALSVPVVLLAIWLVVRRVRRRHEGEEADV